MDNDDSHISQPDKNGVQVRFTRRKKLYSEYFAYNKYGGKENARAAAREWRDHALSTINGKQIR